MTSKKTMIPEEYVAFETAKLLRDAGFPQEPASAFREYFDGDGNHILKQPIARPTQAQAMRWLRENRSLHIEIDAYKRYGKPMYRWSVVFITEDFLFSASDVMTTYEKAAEAGIQDACKYIIKNKETRE